MQKNHFLVLRYLCENTGSTTQRLIAEALKLSLGTTNRALNALREKDFITQDYQVTPAGQEAMAPYKVKNAIILAAGMSTRFIPVS